ncbi:RNAase [Burkholderiaceae bacterium DAT-1]|nr:RNAase [Burkholderiaceae bacterium DAT-1]
MLNRNLYLIKEHVGAFKFNGAYDIMDPESQAIIGVAKEDPGTLIHILRLLINKQMLPTKVEISEREGGLPVLVIKRGFSLLRSRVEVEDGHGKLLGYFKSKLLSIGGGFYVFDARDQQIAEVKGDWKGWNFTFLSGNGLEMGSVSKKWAGLAKELFTSADNYVVSIGAGYEAQTPLLLAAALAIDIVYKEG